MSPRIRRLDPALYRRTPWKNGGGVAVDITDEYEPGAPSGGWTCVVWRFGRTRIETSAPFSDLPGLDRILTVIGGRGLLLRSADGQLFDAREPFRPVRFSGDLAITSELESGPVSVLNLMGARDKVDIDVRVLSGPAAATFPPGTVVAYAPEGATLALGAETVALGPDDAVRLDAPDGVTVESRSGVALIASIVPRRG